MTCFKCLGVDSDGHLLKMRFSEVYFCGPCVRDHEHDHGLDKHNALLILALKINTDRREAGEYPVLPVPPEWAMQWARNLIERVGRASPDELEAMMDRPTKYRWSGPIMAVMLTRKRRGNALCETSIGG